MEIVLSTLGQTIKTARLENKLTQKQLAIMAGITTRFLIAIEKENRCMSMEVFARIVRILKMQTEPIFYPETQYAHSDKDKLVRMIHMCDGRSLNVVEATLRALLENQ